MRLTLPLIYKKNVVMLPSGRRFDLPSLRKAVKVFNALCPRKGGIFNRKHIQTIASYTHEVTSLHLNEDGLCAEIRLYDKMDGKYQIKPVISIPLEEADPAIVLEIRQVQLEVQ